MGLLQLRSSCSLTLRLAAATHSRTRDPRGGVGRVAASLPRYGPATALKHSERHHPEASRLPHLQGAKRPAAAAHAHADSINESKQERGLVLVRQPNVPSRLDFRELCTLVYYTSKCQYDIEVCYANALHIQLYNCLCAISRD